MSKANRTLLKDIKLVKHLNQATLTEVVLGYCTQHGTAALVLT
jgi:hypothetical protein